MKRQRTDRINAAFARRGTQQCARVTGRALFVALVAVIAMASNVSAEDVYSERTMRLASQLQCPVCSGQSVADSQITLAKQMRDVIEEKVQAGETDEQIIAYFEARYGPNVLLEPPKSGFLLTLWWVPPIVLLFGVAIVVLYLREGTSRNVPGRTSGEEPDGELEALATEYLSPDSGAERS